jgi:hypothetical protein
MNKKKLQLVTYEQAKKLKRLGFDLKCLCYYVKDKKKYNFFDFITIKKRDKDCIYPFEHNHNGKKGYFSAPPVALALKWIRDEKKVYTTISVVHNIYLRPEPYYVIAFSGKFGRYSVECLTQKFPSSYEAAESALLDEIIKILEKEKERGKR